MQAVFSGPIRFDPSKAFDWEEEHGFRFPYDLTDDIWVLWETYHYAWEESLRRYRLTLKKGYVSDLASVPRLFWSVIHPAALGSAPWPHDAGYIFRGRFPLGWLHEWKRGAWVECRRVFTRSQVDALFLRIMEDEGIGWWRRHAAWTAVRAGGWIPWATDDLE